jgi:hypothetical protein
MKQGDWVKTETGLTQITNLDSRFARSGEMLYNLETHNEHVFQVSLAGVLVHNSCAWLKNVGDGPDPLNRSIVGSVTESRFRRVNGQYVDQFDQPLNGQWKAIVSIDDEFRMAPSFAGGHHEIAAFSTKRGAGSVQTAGSFWFDNGRLIKADVNSGHFQPRP